MFFVIEGPDGSGKSTQLAMLKDALTSLKREIIVTREPGGTKQGMKIRQMFFDGQGELAPMTEVLLLLASKAQLFHEIVYPALRNDTIVITDRYTDSLYAYQGSGRQLGRQFLSEIVRSAGLDLSPTMTFYIQLPLEVCLQRLTLRTGSDRNAIDNLEREFHERVHEGYRELISNAKKTYRPHVVLDGTRPPDEIHQHIMHALSSFLPTSIAMRD